MRECKCIVQDSFGDKIVKQTSQSAIRMEDAGIHVRKSHKNLDYIEIEFNIIEEEPAAIENAQQYFKDAWKCQKRLLKYNRRKTVRCFVMFDLHTIIKSEDGSVHEDIIP